MTGRRKGQGISSHGIDLARPKYLDISRIRSGRLS